MRGIKVPLFKDPEVTDFLTRYIDEQQRAQNSFMSRVSANHSVLILSPSEKVFEIKVDDAGVISATLVAE